jgi:D-3-phosphoglycerate dehydrogenase / 2-oxoglutarate reductase
MTAPPRVYLSRRLGRAADIGRLLAEGGCEIRPGPVAANPKVVTRFTDEAIARHFGDVDAIVVGAGELISAAVIAGAPRLKTVCGYYIGTEAIDLEACTAAGVIVGYGAVPDNYLGVAEAIVMLSTALLKEVPAKLAAMRGGGWGVADAGRMVAGATFGMIGLGNVGHALARRLAGWDCRLLCHDPYVKPEDAATHGVALVDLDTLLRSSDIVSVQASLTAETHHLIGARELALMRPDAYLVNTARGPLVDEAALRRALDEGRIAGAGLDVWEEEPTSADNPLRTHPRVIATGHNIGHPQTLYDRMVEAAAENVLRALRSEPPLYVRNPAALAAWRRRLAALAGNRS